MEQLQYLIDRLQAIDEKFDEKLDKILVQTTKTNGRVTSLETRFVKTEGEVDRINEHTTFNKGRDRVLWIVVGVVGTISGFLIQYFLSKK